MCCKVSLSKIEHSTLGVGYLTKQQKIKYKGMKKSVTHEQVRPHANIQTKI